MGQHEFNDKLMVVKLMHPARTLLKDSISVTEEEGCIVVKTDSKFNNGKLTAKLYKGHSYAAYFVDTVFSDMRIDPDQLYQFKKDVVSIGRLVERGADVVRIKNEQEYFKRLLAAVTSIRYQLTTSTTLPQINITLGYFGSLVRASITNHDYYIYRVNDRHRAEFVKLLNLVTEVPEATINDNLEDHATYTYGGVNGVHEVHVLRR